MAGNGFDVDYFLERLGITVSEVIEELTPREFLTEVLEKLPGWCDHLVWGLSISKPDEVDLLCEEMRRKVGIAFQVQPERDRRILVESLRGLLRDLDAIDSHRPCNN